MQNEKKTRLKIGTNNRDGQKLGNTRVIQDAEMKTGTFQLR